MRVFVVSLILVLFFSALLCQCVVSFIAVLFFSTFSMLYVVHGRALWLGYFFTLIVKMVFVCARVSLRSIPN